VIVVDASMMHIPRAGGDPGGDLAGGPCAPADPTSRLLAGLPRQTQWLLLLVAVDEEMDVPGLVQATRVAGIDITALSPAELAGLVRVGGGEIRFARPGLRAAVYERATLAQRRAAHLAAAEAAAGCGAFDRSCTALVRAADLTSEPLVASRRLLAAAQHALRSGRPDRARGLLRLAHRPAGGPAGGGGLPARHTAAYAGERELVAGEIELRSAAAEVAVDRFVAAADLLAAAGCREPAAHALMRASEAVCFAGTHSRYAEIAARARALRRAVEPPRLELVFAHVAGFAAVFGGRHKQAGPPLRRCVELGALLDDPSALLLASTASMLLADHPAAWRFAAGAVEAARVTGDRSASPLALLMKAQAEYWLGRYLAAGGTCREGAGTAARSGHANYAADHLGMLAVLAAIRGDPRTCRELLRRMSVPPGAGPRCRPRALGQWALAVCDLMAGRPVEAAVRLNAIGDQTTGEGQVAVQLMAAPWLVEAAARGPEPAPAAEVLAAFDRWAVSAGGPVVRALSARCHALLAPRGSDQAEALFREALRLLGDVDSEFELARTELLLGQELRRRRRPRDAREHLHRARDAFQQLDLVAWVTRAAAELRAAGDKVAAGAAPGPGGAGAAQLTAQQREIAYLVAAGATNREIATQLFLSPRTVDHHLRNVFRKLQVRSRVELVRLLPPAGPAG
jgi:DNA-binding CsgD family transcriptional regulator